MDAVRLIAKCPTLTHPALLVARDYTGHAIDGPRRSLAAATLATSDSATPFFIAVISASIDTAISGGVRLPMYRPIGP
jgi:hypothetical protein